MSKALDWLTTVIFFGFFLLCAFGLIAGLDEFARVPFYSTLPIAACLVTGAALFLFWRNRERTEIPSRIYSKLASGVRAFSETAPAYPGTLRCDKNPGTQTSSTRGSFNRTQSREISAAVAKIHSVAWSFTASAGSVPADIQERMIDHEAR